MNWFRKRFSPKRLAATPRALSGPKSQSGGEPVQVAISRNGAYAVSASKTGHLMVWDASNGNALEDQEVAGVEIYCLAIDTDGRKVLLCGSDEKFQGIVAIANFQKRSIDHIVFQRRPILCVDFSPDGSRMAIGSADWAARVVDPETYDSYFGGSHPDYVYDVKFTADGRELVSVSQDWTLKVWDIHTGALRRSFECEPDIYKVALSADAVWLVTKIGTTCQLIDTETGLPMTTWEMVGDLLSVSNHPTHGIMVWESLPTGAQAFSPRRHEVLCKIPYQTSPVIDLDVSTDGQRLIIGFSDGSISFWSLA